jgi:hypothetical protein
MRKIMSWVHYRNPVHEWIEVFYDDNTNDKIEMDVGGDPQWYFDRYKALKELDGVGIAWGDL